MALSTFAQGLFDHAKNSLPKWLTSGKRTASEWLYGFGEMFEPVYDLAAEWLSGTFITTAEGRWLDQHGKDRDTTRRLNETDEVFRERLRQIEDAVTDPALQFGINAIIGASVTLPFDSYIVISDEINITERQIDVVAGTYTAREILNLLRANLYDGWTVSIHNARTTFRVRHPETFEDLTFRVIWGNEEFRSAMGFDSNAIGSTSANWDTLIDGFYRGYKLSGFCAITHLRRDRAHMHIPGECNSFMSTGYRMTYVGRPAGYIALLPENASDGTPITEATANAVLEYLRQYGPAGYSAKVEFTP